MSGQPTADQAARDLFLAILPLVRAMPPNAPSIAAAEQECAPIWRQMWRRRSPALPPAAPRPRRCRREEKNVAVMLLRAPLPTEALDQPQTRDIAGPWLLRKAGTTR